MNDYTKPSLNKEDYENMYEYRRQWLCVFEKDDGMEQYPLSVSFFCKRLNNQPEITGKVMELREEVFDKVYDTNTVVRMMTNKMFTKKLTKLKNGKKKRVTYLKSFLDMEEYDKYSWISLIETVRYAVLNDEDVVYLRQKEIKLLQ